MVWGRKEGRKDGRKEGRKDGRKEGRKEVRENWNFHGNTMHHQIYCIYTLLEFQQDLDAPSDLLYLHTARVSRGTKCTIRFTVFTHYLSFNRNIMHYQIYYIYTLLEFQ